MILKKSARDLLATLGNRDPLLDVALELEAGARGFLLHRPPALPQRRLLQRHRDEGHRHSQDHVHGHLRDRTDARLDRALEGAGRDPTAGSPGPVRSTSARVKTTYVSIEER